MTHQSGESLSVAVNSNKLLVDDKSLRADVLKNSKSEKTTVSAEELESILIMGRFAILEGIERFYEGMVTANPDLTIVRPSIWTAQLGTTVQTEGRNSQVYTAKGYANGGINESIDEIKARFHSHWLAVRNAGFMPEVRQTTGARDGGSWLYLRKPTLDEAAYHWLGHRESPAQHIIKGALHERIDPKETPDPEDRAFGMRCIRIYRVAGEMAIDMFAEASGDSLRSRQQIGLEVAISALNAYAGNTDAFETNIDDALDYARNDRHTDDAAVRAIENAVY